MPKKPTRAKVDIDQSPSPLQTELPAVSAVSAGCQRVWSGSIARLRVYDQPASTGKKVFAYTAPGSNANYVGHTDDHNIVHVLLLARDNGRSITGFTNASCRIEWIDY